MSDAPIYSHKTVLKKEAIDCLIKNPEGIYLDATAGGGGHSEEILQRFPKVKLISCDWHLEALKTTKERLQEYSDRHFIEFSSFSHLGRITKKLKFHKVDGILADFGTSMYQLEHVEGFSFRTDTFLDMRMSKSHHTNKAYDIINFASEAELIKIFFDFGEEQHSKKIAREIVAVRKDTRIKTTAELVAVVKKALKITTDNHKINPATKVFQALRIAVNDELQEIFNLICHVAPEILKPSGTMVCISFHSLEDRIVKHAFKEKMIWNCDNKVIYPSEDEILNNPSSRSAKMRVAEKV